MYRHHQTVQLHHTDAYGILFFANQLPFCHDAFQSWLTDHGHPLAPTRDRADFVAVVVQADSTYKAPVRVSDRLTLAYSVSKVGTTSFINDFRITNQDDVHVGQVRVVQVTIDPVTSCKMPIPPWLRALLLANGP